MTQSLFTNSSVHSTRIIYTPSFFARTSLIHLQEVGTLKALYPHKSERSGLHSYLFFIVLSGMGRLTYGGKKYDLITGDCVFIDCKKSYSHETGITFSSTNSHINITSKAAHNLWSLQWCHFYGSSMPAIYEKYRERGGSPVFHPENSIQFTSLIAELYKLASSPDYIRDMRINENLNKLLTLIMEQSWHPESGSISKKRMELADVKTYIDEHYTNKISLDDLSSQFFINKYYLTRIFKEAYGSTINAYILNKRITRAKHLLRFSGLTIDEIAAAVGMEDANYFSRAFRKVEGVSPTKYKKQW